VLLNTKNIRFKTPGVRKFMPRFIGPFPIEAMVGDRAAKLTLPADLRIHPVFHVSLLKHFRSDGKIPPPPVFTLDDNAYWLAEALVDHRDVPKGNGRFQRQYYVKWEGYDHTTNTWEPEESLLESEPLEREIEGYEARLPLAQRKDAVHARLQEERQERRAPAIVTRPVVHPRVDANPSVAKRGAAHRQQPSRSAKRTKS
jgi:hypothetical protein